MTTTDDNAGEYYALIAFIENRHLTSVATFLTGRGQGGEGGSGGSGEPSSETGGEPGECDTGASVAAKKLTH